MNHPLILCISKRPSRSALKLKSMKWSRISASEKSRFSNDFKTNRYRINLGRPRGTILMSFDAVWCSSIRKKLSGNGVLSSGNCLSALSFELPNEENEERERERELNNRPPSLQTNQRHSFASDELVFRRTAAHQRAIERQICFRIAVSF